MRNHTATDHLARIIPRRLLMVVAMAVSIDAGVGCAQQTGPADVLRSLGAATQSFLDLWLRGEPAAAVDKYLSPVTVQRPQLLPSPTEFGKLRPAGVQAARSDARRFFSEELSVLRQELSPKPGTPILAPTTRETASEIVNALDERKINIRTLDQPSAIVFQVNSWNDIAWVGSASQAHRDIIRSGELLKRPLFGVVIRLVGPDPTQPVPVLLLWQQEQERPTSDWKLVTMLPILTA